MQAVHHSRGGRRKVSPTLAPASAAPGWPRALQRALAGLLCASAVAAASAQSAVLTGTVLGAIGVDLGEQSYGPLGDPPTLLTVRQLDGASMTGGPPGFEGLWLGSDYAGGLYSLRFSQPVGLLRLDIVGLSYDVDQGVGESLTGFATDSATTPQFASADGSATWEGGVLGALDLDSRATLQFVASSPGGFSRLDFSHLQPILLNGFVIRQIGFSPLAVPEPSGGALFAVGLPVLLGWGWRRRRQAALVRTVSVG